MLIINEIFVINKMLIASEVDYIENSNKLIENFVKLKTRKLFKLKNLFKPQNLAKFGKKLSKNRNLSNFDIKKIELSFLTSNAKTTFNCL